MGVAGQPQHPGTAEVLGGDEAGHEGGGMAGTDGAGYGGFHDQVDNHYLRTFGSAILVALIGAGVGVTPLRALAEARQALLQIRQEGRQRQHHAADAHVRRLGITVPDPLPSGVRAVRVTRVPPCRSIPSFGSAVLLPVKKTRA